MELLVVVRHDVPAPRLCVMPNGNVLALLEILPGVNWVERAATHP